MAAILRDNVGFFYQQWRTIAALVFAGGLVVWAYTTGTSSTPVAEASPEASLLSAIANKDSTGDGVPDWEKALYGIPVNATTTDYFHLGMTDGEAIAKGLIVPIAQTPSVASSTPGSDVEGGVPASAPGSLTDAFSKDFIALYVNAENQNGGNFTSDQINQIADQALSDLSQSVSPSPDFVSQNSLKEASSGPGALKTYAATAEHVLTSNTSIASKDELYYLQGFLSTNNQADLANLASIANAYHAGAEGLAVIPVPPEALQADTTLVNAFARMGEIADDFNRVESDPLAAMLALKQYPGVVQNLANGFAALPPLYTQQGVVFSKGEAGSRFVNFTTSADNTAP